MMLKLLIFVSIVVLSQGSRGQMAGGWTTVDDTNSKEVQDIARFAAEKMTVELGSPYRMRLMDILSAKSQVVAGKNYKMEMKIGATTCKVKEDDADISDCELLNCGDVYICSATVWSRPWLQDTRLTKYSCDKKEKSC